jgi:hypothetical protein
MCGKEVQAKGCIKEEKIREFLLFNFVQKS